VGEKSAVIIGLALGSVKEKTVNLLLQTAWLARFRFGTW
jgi:hypothetical protein